MIIVTLNVSQPNQSAESGNQSFSAPSVKPRMQGNQPRNLSKYVAKVPHF